MSAHGTSGAPQCGYAGVVAHGKPHEPVEFSFVAFNLAVEVVPRRLIAKAEQPEAGAANLDIVPPVVIRNGQNPFSDKLTDTAGSNAKGGGKRLLVDLVRGLRCRPCAV
jgi:hypothetical protein